MTWLRKVYNISFFFWRYFLFKFIYFNWRLTTLLLYGKTSIWISMQSLWAELIGVFQDYIMFAKRCVTFLIFFCKAIQYNFFKWLKIKLYLYWIWPKRFDDPKGNQSWIFIGRTDVEAETPILWPPDMKSWLIGKDPDGGKDWGQEEKGTTEDEMVGWHHRLAGHGFG